MGLQFIFHGRDKKPHQHPFPSGETFEDNLSENIHSEVKFSKRSSALQDKQKTRKRILPFVTEYHSVVFNLKNILMAKKWHLIKNQHALPLLKDILVRAKL